VQITVVESEISTSSTVIVPFIVATSPLFNEYKVIVAMLSTVVSVISLID